MSEKKLRQTSFAKIVALAPLTFGVLASDVSAQGTTTGIKLSEIFASTDGTSETEVAPTIAISEVTRTISIPEDGVYVIEVSDGFDFDLEIDGNLVLSEAGSEPNVITTLSSGEHRVTIIGAADEAASFASITIRQSGSTEVANLSDFEVEATAVIVPSERFLSETSIEGSRVATKVRDILEIDAATIDDAGDGGAGGGAGGGGAGDPNPIDITDALPSPLTPPTDFAPTQEIELSYAGDGEGLVSNTGVTLFGEVMDSTTYDIIDVAISNGRETTIDVGPVTGQFALRLFEEDFADGADLTLTFTAKSSLMESVELAPVSYNVTGVQSGDGIVQALSRLTFGPTPDLYARLKAIGYEAYVEEQLNPATIDDQYFESLNVDQLLDRTEDRHATQFPQIDTHRMAYAAYSERQLQHVMAHFWSNHFHAATKDTLVEKQNIADIEFYRANALGNFEDMLMYSARSPLMSQFLDNDENSVGNINENYAREVMELHTVGVNGGYTNQDIIEVAKILTGWNYYYTNPEEGPLDLAEEHAFIFNPEDHDSSDKYLEFLDTTIVGRTGEEGVAEGEELLTLLANQPSTHRFVCGKLVEYLVADEMPEYFVNVCADAWAASGGEVVDILRAILLDPAYIQTAEYQRNKAKTPFEYVVSFMRAFEYNQLDNENRSQDQRRGRMRDLRTIFIRAGYNPLFFGVPTGLPEDAGSLFNTGALAQAYDEMTDLLRDTGNFDLYIHDLSSEYGLETPEEVASFFLTVLTANRFRQTEFDVVVEILKGTDGIFDPMNQVHYEGDAHLTALGYLILTPSFLLQ